jgi:hypothetical protein
MNYLLTFIGIGFLVLACFLWAKFAFILSDKLYYFVFRNKIKENQNPYIAEQKARMWNTRMYEEYEKWMRKKGEGIPIEKIVTQDEYEAIEKIKKYLND